MRKPNRTQRKLPARLHTVDNAAPVSFLMLNGIEMQRKRKEKRVGANRSASPPCHTTGATARRANKRKTNAKARHKQRHTHRRKKTHTHRRTNEQAGVSFVIGSTRRIASPTNNRRAPPTESKKSIRSVNPTGVRTGCVFPF